MYHDIRPLPWPAQLRGQAFLLLWIVQPHHFSPAEGFCCTTNVVPPLHHTSAVSPVAVLRTLLVARRRESVCLLNTSGRTTVTLKPVSTTIGHITPSISPLTVRLPSLWDNCPVINITCGVILIVWWAGLSPSRPACPRLNEVGKVLVLHISWFVFSNLPTVSFQVAPSRTSPALRGPETIGGYHFSEQSFNLCKYIILQRFPAIRLISWTPFCCTTIHASNRKFPLAEG